MYFKICVALLLVGGGLGEKTENEAGLNRHFLSENF